MRGWLTVATALVPLTVPGCTVGRTSAPPPLAALKDCGTENYGHGEGYDAVARNCIVAAHRDGVAARFVSSVLTVEGDPIRLELIAGANGKVTAVHDTRADKFGDQKLFTYECSVLELRTAPNDQRQRVYFHLGQCTGSGTEFDTW